jgi:hypothetical protein
MAIVLAACGDGPAAVEQAHRAINAVQNMPPMWTYALAVQAHVFLNMGDTHQAAEAARMSMASLEKLGTIDEGEAFVRLTFAEAMLAIGEVNLARAAILDARKVLEARAARIADPIWTTSFLQCVPENAKIMALAGELLKS